MRAARAFALLVPWYLATATAAAHTAVIQLHHRPAAAVLPVLKGFAASDGAAVGGSGRTLMLKGDKAAVNDLVRLIHRLDVPLRRLAVTVSTEDHAPPPALPPGTTVYSTRRGDTPAGGARIEDTRRLKDGGDRRLDVVEGRWASVTVTWRVPELRQQVGIVAGGGQQVFNGLNYRQVTGGIAVRPVVMGDEVTVTIRARRADPTGSGGVTAVENTETTVSGRLGQWLEVSGAGDGLDLNDGGAARALDRRVPLFVRVDETR